MLVQLHINFSCFANCCVAVDHDDFERMQSVESLLGLANGDAEADCLADTNGSVEDDTNITIDTMALSASDDYQLETQQQHLAADADGYVNHNCNTVYQKESGIVHTVLCSLSFH